MCQGPCTDFTCFFMGHCCVVLHSIFKPRKLAVPRFVHSLKMLPFSFHFASGNTFHSDLLWKVGEAGPQFVYNDFPR